MENDSTGDEDAEAAAADKTETFLFAERDEVFQCIQRFCTATDTSTTVAGRPGEDPAAASHDDDENNAAASEIAAGDALQRFRTILDKYLECPTLMDQSLEAMVDQLAQCVRQCFLLGLTPNDDDDDNHSRAFRQRRALSALYALCKVRGRKCVQRFLPHGVDDVERIWMGLQRALLLPENKMTARQAEPAAATTTTTTVTAASPPAWESVYVLWTWMGILSLVPFECHVILGVTTRDDQDTSSSSFLAQLVSKCQEHLTDAGPVRDVASSCLASWLSRPDQQAQLHRKTFVEYSRKKLIQFSDSNLSSSNDDLFGILGILQTLTALLKGVTVDRFIVIHQIVHPLWDIVLQLADHRSCFADNLLLHKLLVKWWTRASCALLPRRRLAPWRYQRGKRALFGGGDFGCGGDDPDNRQSLLEDETRRAEEDVAVDQETEFFDVPDQVEDAMGRILEALSHHSTVVRWSAAKGVGRITERLPALCGDDVLDEILESLLEDDSHNNNDRSWHGTCLALAELARRGLIAPPRLSELVPLLVRAIQYDRRRPNMSGGSVGAHVRDAACYTYWALVRAYPPVPPLQRLHPVMVVTSLLDREVNCRRAASAAFQEAVGRQGATHVPHGIEILTTADFFALGNRNEAYLTIARKIAEFDKHRRPIIRHLATCKLFHWDWDIRALASKSLHNLTSLDVAFLGRSVLPDLLDKCLDVQDLHTRHGALLGTAEIVLALSEISQMAVLSSETVKSLADLVPAIEKKRLYRGRGGEIMRSAVCRFIECVSIARLKLDVREQVRFLDSVDANIPHPSEPISRAASMALESLLTNYFPVGENGPSQRLQTRVVDKFVKLVDSSENPAATRGYSLALGYLPAKLLAPTKDVLEKVIACLCESANPKSVVGGDGDAETRRNALLSLSRVVTAVGFHPSPPGIYKAVALDGNLVRTVFETFLASFGDYNSDRRGDVGSWCRLVAMDGATDLLCSCGSSQKAKPFLNESDATRLTAAILKQLSERLDTVRQKAGDCLLRLLHPVPQCDLSTICPSQKSALAAALGVTNAVHHAKWKDASYVFPRVLAAASLPEPLYFDSVVAGIAYSIGSRGEKVGSTASAALVSWAKQQNSERLELLGNSLFRVMEKNRGVGRIVLPVLKTLDALFSNRCLDFVTQSNGRFGEQCLSILQQEASSKEIARLFAIVDVTIALLFALPDNISTSKQGLEFLCSMLSHPFPRIRSYAAEQFYVLLLEYDGGKRTKAIKMIVSTPWSSELTSAERQQFAAATAQVLEVDVDFQNCVRQLQQGSTDI